MRLNEKNNIMSAMKSVFLTGIYCLVLASGCKPDGGKDKQAEEIRQLRNEVSALKTQPQSPQVNQPTGTPMPQNQVPQDDTNSKILAELERLVVQYNQTVVSTETALETRRGIIRKMEAYWKDPITENYDMSTIESREAHDQRVDAYSKDPTIKAFEKQWSDQDKVIKGLEQSAGDQYATLEKYPELRRYYRESKDNSGVSVFQKL